MKSNYTIQYNTRRARVALKSQNIVIAEDHDSLVITIAVAFKACELARGQARVFSRRERLWSVQVQTGSNP